MRIDYFVAAEQLKDRIVSCEMHGQGIELQGMTYSISNITSAGLCIFLQYFLFFDDIFLQYLELAYKYRFLVRITYSLK